MTDSENLMPKLMGFSHIDLTVSNCERAVAWWQDVLGFTLVNRHRDQALDDSAIIHPSGAGENAVTHYAAAPSDMFDERRSLSTTFPSEWPTSTSYVSR